MEDKQTAVRCGADDPIRYCTVGGSGSTRSHDLYIKRVGASAPMLQSLLLSSPHHQRPQTMARKHNKKIAKEERLLSQRAVQLKPVPRTVKASAPAARTPAPTTSVTQTTPATVAASPHRSPSVPPDALATQPQDASDSPRGRSQDRRTVSSDSEYSCSPPPTPKRKRAREVSGLSDEQVIERYRKMRKTLRNMEIANATRK